MVKNIIDRIKVCWYWLLIAAGMVIGGFKLASFGAPDNYLIMAPGALILIGGFALGYWGIKRRPKFRFGPSQPAPQKRVQTAEVTESEADDDATKVVSGYEANSINIYRDRVVYEYVQNPLGVPWRCIDDGKFYYVHAVDKDKNLIEWQLPDNDLSKRHYDPAEFANVITMPCAKRFFEWAPNKFQKIALAAMAIIACVELFVLFLIVSG